MSGIEIGMQNGTRQSLSSGHSRSSLKSVDTTIVSLHCVDSGELGSEKGVFLQSRYASNEEGFIRCKHRSRVRTQ